MVFAILGAIAVSLTFLLIMARYASNPSVLRAQLRVGDRTQALKPDIHPGLLRDIVSELFESMGLSVIETEPLSHTGGTRLIALGFGVLRPTRHIIYLEACPEGDFVDGSTLLALVDDVNHNNAVLGVVVTPHEIDRSGVAGIAMDLELIDGRALMALVSEFLPARVTEMARYRLADTTVRGWPSKLNERVARARIPR